MKVNKTKIKKEKKQTLETVFAKLNENTELILAKQESSKSEIIFLLISFISLAVSLGLFAFGSSMMGSFYLVISIGCLVIGLKQ